MVRLLLVMLLPFGGRSAFPAHPRVAASALDMRTAGLLLVYGNAALDVWARFRIEFEVQLG